MAQHTVRQFSNGPAATWVRQLQPGSLENIPMRVGHDNGHTNQSKTSKVVDVVAYIYHPVGR